MTQLSVEEVLYQALYGKPLLFEAVQGLHSKSQASVVHHRQHIDEYRIVDCDFRNTVELFIRTY